MLINSTDPSTTLNWKSKFTFSTMFNKMVVISMRPSAYFNHESDDEFIRKENYTFSLYKAPLDPYNPVYIVFNESHSQEITCDADNMEKRPGFRGKRPSKSHSINSSDR